MILIQCMYILHIHRSLGLLPLTWSCDQGACGGRGAPASAALCVAFSTSACLNVVAHTAATVTIQNTVAYGHRGHTQLWKCVITIVDVGRAYDCKVALCAVMPWHVVVIES